MLLSNIIWTIPLFLVCLAQEGTKQSWPREITRLSNDFYRLKKRQDDQGYFEQCRRVNLWKGQLGYVNVFAFLDASWLYSYRQAIMLKLLKKRLERSKFSDIWFFAIAAPPDFPEDKTENEIEIEAWREISTHESSNFLNSGEVSLNDLTKDSGSDIVFIQDSPALGIWESFRASKDQVIVIDRCGKLTYQVIVPWSILYFPYVKAAILSTYKEDPCGPCNIRSTPIYKPMDYEEFLFEKTTEKGETSTNEDVDILRKESSTDAEFDISTIPPSQPTITEFYADANTVFSMDTDSNIDDIATEPTVESGTLLEYLEFDKKTSEPSMEMTFTATESTEDEDNTMSIENTTPPTVLTDTDEGITSIPFISSREEESRIPSIFIESTTTESYGKVQDRTLLDEPIDGDNGNSVRTTTLDAIVERNGEDDHEAAEDGSRNTKDGQEISSVDFSKEFRNSEDNAAQALLNDEPLPIRVIMRAPHLHQEEDTFKEYKYLILKTDNPGYHEHYDSGRNVIPPYWQVSKDVALEREKPEDTMERSKILGGNIYSPDESPGLYGEVADYWRNYEDTDYINRNQITESKTDYDDVSTTDNETDIDGPLKNENPTKSIDSDASQSTGEVEVDVDTEESVQTVDRIIPLEKSNFDKEDDMTIENTREEQIRHKLIEHYSKLLPWIYYVLN